MEPEAEITFEFTAWPDVRVRQVEGLEIYLQQGGSGMLLPPDVWLWNVEAREWDAIDAEWGLYAVPDAHVYVNASGSVLLRVGAKEDAMEIQDVAISIRGRR